MDDPEELFDVIEELGKGSYGSVFRAVHLPSGKEVALKVMKLDALTDVKELKAEITLLSKIKCTNVVKYFGSYIKNKALWISMEYCDAGSALDMLIQLKKPFTEQQICSLVYQAIQGLCYLHSMSPPVVHRDIKAGNILLNSKGEVKLADFGVATQLTDTLAKRQTQIGSPFYMAPEIIQESPYDTKVDIWSLGITAIELAQMKPPHWEAGSIRALFLIATKPSPKLNEPEKWSTEFNQFLARCLVKNPKERPPAKELLTDTFVNKIPEKSQDILAALVDECFLEESERSSDPSESDTASFNTEALKALTYSTLQKTMQKDDARKFTIRGEAREGEQLTAEGEALKSEGGHRFVWFKMHPNSENECVPIEGVSSKSNVYTITKEDINCCIKCTCISEKEGFENSLNAVTEVVRPGKPQVRNIRIEGGPYFTRMFKLIIDYFGGDEGPSKIQWFKSTPDGKFLPIKDATGLIYQPTSSDINARLEVKYTPIRSDGEQGLPIFVVSKPILKVVGRILLYSSAGAPACLHAKYILMQKSVPFVEIDLFKYPKRVTEMEKLTKGKKTVPQVFFNDKHIGGLRELLILEESGKLSQLLKETLDVEPPDFPKPPTEEEEAETSKVSLSITEEDKMYSLYLDMRDIKQGIPIKVRGPITKRVKSFKGVEMMKWLHKHLESTEDATQIAQLMKDQTYFHRIKDNNLPFANDLSLYSFQADIFDGLMLNTDKVWPVDHSKRGAISVSQDLLKQMLKMIEQYGSAIVLNGKKILIFSQLTVSHEYRNFVNTAFELQGVELGDLNEKELKAFFLNVYNSLIYHATIVISVGLLKIPDNDYHSWGKIGYVINGQKYSLHDLEHGILRGNRKASKRKIKTLLSKHDPRAKFILPFDPRVHFAMLRGYRSNSAASVFHPSTVDQELQMCTEGILEDELEIDKTKNTIAIPRLFYYYSKDFGKNDAAMLQWICASMSPTSKKKEELELLMEKKFTLKYVEFIFDLEGGTFFDDESDAALSDSKGSESQIPSKQAKNAV